MTVTTRTDSEEIHLYDNDNGESALEAIPSSALAASEPLPLDLDRLVGGQGLFRGLQLEVDGAGPSTDHAVSSVRERSSPVHSREILRQTGGGESRPNVARASP